MMLLRYFALLSTVTVALLTAPGISSGIAPTVTANADSGSVWQGDWDTAMEIARTQKKPVVVDFHTKHCGSCKAMHKYTFTDSEVKKRLAADWICISVNTAHGWKTGTWEGKSLPYNKLAKHFRVKGVPTYLFIDSDGKAVQAVVGFKEKELFCDILDFLSERAYEEGVTFADFKESRK